MEQVIHSIPFWLVFVLCGTAHEFLHAWSAYRLGDPTSKEGGRLTLNPLVHIDPIGTVVFPFLNAWLGQGLLIGWMRPVPVNPLNFRRTGRDMLLVSLAGPFANLSFAFLGFLFAFGSEWALADVPMELIYWISLNLALAFFNLLPIPPLDGSSIVDWIRRDESGSYHAQGNIGMMALYLLLLMGGLKYLWIAVEETVYFMNTFWFLPVLVFLALAFIGTVFFVKTSPRSARSPRKKGKPGKSVLIYEKARTIGRKLEEGAALSRSEKDWIESIRRDHGDGEDLCSPISFHGDNDFCAACPNLNRCALRLIESLGREQKGEPLP